MRYLVTATREQFIEAVVEAESKEDAEELVFVAQSDGSRPEGLIEFYDNTDAWLFESEETPVDEEDE